MGQDKVREFVEKHRTELERIWKARRPLLWFNGVVALVGVLYLILIVRPIYESSVTILPEYGSKSTLGGVEDLASLAGFNLGEASPMEIYKNIIVGEAVLDPVINAKYKTDEYRDSVTLLQYFEIMADFSGPDIDTQRAKLVKYFNIFSAKTLTVDLDPLTKVLTLKVQMPERMLSANVVNNIAHSLDTYIRSQRKSNATNQRMYLEKRLATVRDSLTIAEERLRDFNTFNRVVAQSPELQLVQQRMTRNVDILNTVFLEITKQLELARMNEVKDMPVLNIREFAKDPIYRIGPNRKLRFFLIMLGSIVLSGGVVALKDVATEKFRDLRETVKLITRN